MPATGLRLNFMGETAYILKIKDPCSQDWNSMTNVENGRFCSQCSKNVIDLSGLTDKEVYKIIHQTSGRICGRLSISQLDKPILPPPANTRFSLPKFFAGLLLLGLSKTTNAFGREIKNNIELVPATSFSKTKVSEKNFFDTTHLTIRGKVIDAQTKEFLQGVVVIIKGTTTGIVTDIDGNFSLTIPDSLLNTKVDLVIQYVGYSTKEFTVTRNDLESSKEFFITQLEQALSGEVIITKKKKWWKFWK